MLINILIGLSAIFLAIAVPLAILRRQGKPWALTLTEDLAPKHPKHPDDLLYRQLKESLLKHADDRLDSFSMYRPSRNRTVMRIKKENKGRYDEFLYRGICERINDGPIGRMVTKGEFVDS